MNKKDRGQHFFVKNYQVKQLTFYEQREKLTNVVRRTTRFNVNKFCLTSLKTNNAVNFGLAQPLEKYSRTVP